MALPAVPPIQTILTYHVEGELETPSREVFEEIAAQVILADRLGYHAAWFAEHHFHVHRGHLPNPVLFALHLAGRTERIHLGSAVITSALHHPLRLAEDVITTEVLTGGRLSIGLGSGSTKSEFAAFGVPEEDQEAEARHARFAEGLDVLEQAWSGQPVSVHGRYVHVDCPPVLPHPDRSLSDLLWIAANSVAQASVSGRRGYGIMLSRERGPGEMQQIVESYWRGRAEAGLPRDGGRVAASRPVYVGASDRSAREEASNAVTEMVARQKRERAQYRDLPPPADFDEACARVQFVVGGPDSVAEEVRKLYDQVPFTHLHIQPRWKGLTPQQVEGSISRFQREVIRLTRD
ncbi:MAG TPA: LLM class flavin-dependent oxidoreductase [Chloroflexota bacterium]|nr:LLM class flavin-dependent oxidoreductase [Chloroflexota bacterium]